MEVWLGYFEKMNKRLRLEKVWRTDLKCSLVKKPVSTELRGIDDEFEMRRAFIILVIVFLVGVARPTCIDHLLPLIPLIPLSFFVLLRSNSYQVI